MIITIISTVALAIILQGCGSSSSSNSSEPKTEVSSSIKSFAQSLGDNEISKVAKKGSSSSTNEIKTANKRLNKSVVQNCEDGGSREVISDNQSIEDLENQLLSGNLKVTIIDDSCIEDGVKSSGSVEMEVSNEIMNILFKEKTTFEDLETTEIITIFKGSKIKIEEVSETTEKITESLKATSSTGKSYETITLVTYSKERGNDELVYDISGSIVHEGESYRVDESYDASKTPMVFKDYERLVGGTAKYYNEKNEHITIKVISENQIKVSVDSDNDGTVDEEEVLDI